MMKTTHIALSIRWARLPLVLLALTLGRSTSAAAQALPAAEAAPISTGFALPTVLGSLNYAVTASQSLVYGFYGNTGSAASTNISGDLAYLSSSKRSPFSLVLTGGRAFGEFNEPSYNYLGLGFSQVANIGKWDFVISDDVSYLPGTAAAGLAGVPGVGDLGVSPIQVGGDQVQGLLTNFSNRITNTVSGGVSRQLTGKTSLNASGSYSTIRFLDSTVGSQSASSAGLDDDSASATGGIDHQLDARNTIGGNYTYSRYSYSNNSFGITTPGFYSQAASGLYSRHISRKLFVSLAAGPQWTTLLLAPSTTSLSVFVDASAVYSGKLATGSLTFLRSTNNGFGTIGGALSTGVAFSFSRQFATVWSFAASSSYTQTSNLPVAGIPPYSANTYVEGAQISRAFLRSLSGFASYTFENQAVSGTGAIDVFSGTSQVLGFGVTYSPSAIHLGRP